jgi:RNA polymerase sigma-70 factor, ECF subfamily
VIPKPRSGSTDTLYEDFFRSIGPRLIALGYVFTGDSNQAQDLAQETLLRAWRRWDTVSGYDDPGAWCRRVLCNLATSEWRKATRRRFVPASASVVPEPDIEALELARALDTLPPPQRSAIVLHDAGGLSVAEVARELEVPEGTVRSWLSRGRRTLAAQLSLAESDDEVVEHDDATH